MQIDTRFCFVLLAAAVMFAGEVLAQEERVNLQDYVDRFEKTPVTTGLSLNTDAERSATESQRIKLGRKLFFDTRLSKDGTVSCASCHRPDQAFALNKNIAAGVDNKPGRRNAPSLLNRRFGTAQFWDGRASSLEEQALQPIESENELGHSIAEVLSMLNNDEEYTSLFARAFDNGVTQENLGSAIASFERSLLSGGSAIDKFQNSEQALTEKQRHGLWLYESKGGCWRCHSGANYSDEDFHNTGVSWGVEPLDLGKFEVSEVESDKGKFRTPSLRDVALTAPYMHDGSMATLKEVVEFYNRGGTENPHLDENLKPLNLTDSEVDSLVEFLKALTGDHPWQED